MAKVINFAEEKKAREIAEMSVLEFEIYAVVKNKEQEFVSEEVLGGFTCKYQEAFDAFGQFLSKCMPYLIDNYARSEYGFPYLELRSVKSREGKKVCAAFELKREEVPMKDFTYIKLTPELISVDMKETE